MFRNVKLKNLLRVARKCESTQRERERKRKGGREGGSEREKERLKKKVRIREKRNNVEKEQKITTLVFFLFFIFFNTQTQYAPDALVVFFLLFNNYYVSFQPRHCLCAFRVTVRNNLRTRAGIINFGYYDSVIFVLYGGIPRENSGRLPIESHLSVLG